ncbi:chromosome segregation protein SMC [Arthrobacter sp. MSA 4-2]|uniref:chromosome segregation protein SMC n=1 Tax=Arthrobacter sp. MSA 4-2 TaxID=2794349 RepID=UPI0018E8679D|nr:chromosome segregation protein SMC [Arthrobacter sp. MSA 4-2]MBJ2120024.1 chromosome segregation protein SMC [Arthrobacter sp. MSA 4-2]
MHLKSLTVRGFKSFASATTFDFEPGVTAVVGPNGSGKSNVVDALAWVMGEQGAKTLRGGKMEDVIFAGTAGRPPLGRAQVTLTIDNADGALPIEYSEVTISRTLFRSGGSEYAINGRNCRLLDIQELLSDSGLGREMHVIVGQGQLDRVLHATPEERRGFIEEAAGILKHRRRREKTVRKLESMEANLARLTDLTAELRRQLTPLGKQAEVARRAQQVQFEVRDARARLLADELVGLQEALAREAADETAARQRHAEVEALLEAQRARQGGLERLAAEAAPALTRARDDWYRLTAVAERYRSLQALAAERSKLLGVPAAAPDRGRDPDELDRQARRLRVEEEELKDQILENAQELESAIVGRAEAEEAAAAEEKRLTALLRAAADRREGVARLAGQVGAARSRVESVEAELGRLGGSISEALARQEAAEREFAALEEQVAGAVDGEEGLDAAYEEAQAELERLAGITTALDEIGRAAERERDALAARRGVQLEGLRQRDGSQALLAAGIPGVGEPLAGLIRVEPGYETAVAAALAGLTDAVSVADAGTAVAALRRMKEDDAGQVAVVVAGPAGSGGNAALPSNSESTGTGAEAGSTAGPTVAPPAGARYVLDLLSTGPALRHSLAAVLDGVVVVEDLDAAHAAVQRQPGLTAVTRDGDTVSASTARGGSPGAPSLLEIQAAVEETTRRLEHASAQAEDITRRLADAAAQKQLAAERAAAALEKLHESDARLSAVEEKLGQLGSAVRSAGGEADRLRRLAQTAEGTLELERTKLKDAEERLSAVQELPDDPDPSTEVRDRLSAAAGAARQSEMDARLTLRSAEEQLHALANRAASLERAAASERQARLQAAERARIRQAQAARARAVAAAAGTVLEFIAASIAAAEGLRAAAERRAADAEAQLGQARAAHEALVAELARLTDALHRDELVRAGQRLRIEALENRSVEELGLTPEHLTAEYGPHLPVPSATASEDKWADLRLPVDDDGRVIAEGVPFVRAEQEKRLRRAERDLAALGKVNPLALEEFAALEERHTFLSTQLGDLKATRKDLLDIIREVDERVEQVFTAAYRDTAVQFEHVFGRLFPGGEGRLVLTDPEDMLATGIEVEARPAGKRIKRLSLLSGGERSLTAVALLVAIFKARPSPFYVMDEVEAALDDTNLGRLLSIFEELRESSQLIIITHQKRTMEVADALYGVSMRGDGVSAVISQRLVGA